MVCVVCWRYRRAASARRLTARSPLLAPNPQDREATKIEVDLLRKLNHPNIVGYKESFLTRTKETLCIVMTYCDGGDLADVIKVGKR